MSQNNQQKWCTQINGTNTQENQIISPDTTCVYYDKVQQPKTEDPKKKSCDKCHNKKIKKDAKCVCKKCECRFCNDVAYIKKCDHVAKFLKDDLTTDGCRMVSDCSCKDCICIDCEKKEVCVGMTPKIDTEEMPKISEEAVEIIDIAYPEITPPEPVKKSDLNVKNVDIKENSIQQVIVIEESKNIVIGKMVEDPNSEIPKSKKKCRGKCSKKKDGTKKCTCEACICINCRYLTTEYEINKNKGCSGCCSDPKKGEIKCDCSTNTDELACICQNCMCYVCDDLNIIGSSAQTPAPPPLKGKIKPKRFCDFGIVTDKPTTPVPFFCGCKDCQCYVCDDCKQKLTVIQEEAPPREFKIKTPKEFTCNCIDCVCYVCDDMNIPQKVYQQKPPVPVSECARDRELKRKLKRFGGIECACKNCACETCNAYKLAGPEENEQQIEYVSKSIQVKMKVCKGTCGRGR